MLFGPSVDSRMYAKEPCLCMYCSKFIPIQDEPHTTRPFHRNAVALLRQSGSCALCNFIKVHSSLDSSSLPPLDDGCYPYEPTTIVARVREPQVCEDGIRWAILEITLAFSGSGGWSSTTHTFSITTCQVDCTYLHFYFFKHSDSSKANTGRQAIWTNQKSTSLELDEKISKIKTWLRHCELQHAHDCTPSQGQLPKRLIEVSSADASPRLALGSEVADEQSRYATLSHCWGGTLPIRTLRQNVEEFSKGIPFELFPRTFRDAITITQRLSIPYLWIDALCIVQDSKEEWETEALRMKDVYAGGIINIAASDASSGQEGCFRDHGLDDEDRTLMFETNDPAGIRTLVVRVQLGDIRQATKQTILSTRGWVLQEQLLSHRVVSCMYPELHWECRKIYQTEGGAQYHKKAPNIFGTPRLSWRSSVDLPHWMWWSWMQNFAARKFTSWRDRLPALAGITQHYENMTGDTPLLGLWKTSLLGELLWIRLGQHTSVRYEDLHFANLPSWSWLSCPATIMFDIWQISSTTHQRYIINQDRSILVDYQVNWAGSPFTSVIRSAYITLEGPTIEVFVQPAPDARPSNPPCLEITGGDIVPNQDGTSNMCVGQFDGIDSIPATYSCLLLRSRTHSETKARREMFLILRPVSDSSTPRLHRRVGIGCFRGEISNFANAAQKMFTLV